MRNTHSNSGLSEYFRFLDVGAFLRWWGRGLLGCLPLSVQRFFVELPTHLILEVFQDEIICSQEQGEEFQELGRYSLQSVDPSSLLRHLPRAKRKQIVLRLPADKVLSKKISLPMAAEANLRQVVGFEIDRLTPFGPGQVYYDVRIMERQPVARRMQVEFTVVPCSIVDPLLKRFSEIGLPPDRVDVAGINNAINLLPEEKIPPKNRGAQRIQLALIILALALVMAASALPLWQQRHLVTTLLPQVRVSQAKAEEVFALREELESSIESSRFLLQKKREAPLVIQILNELTVLLPDNTSIERLEIKDKTVQIRGQSLEASALIGLVEASELFHGVTFLSPVTADRRTGRDRFFLSAQISRES